MNNATAAMDADFLLTVTVIPDTAVIVITLEVVELRTRGLIAAAPVRLSRLSVPESDLLCAGWDPHGRPAPSSVAGLSLDLWTNLGREGLIVRTGDPLVVSVTVNRSCYLRLVYIRPDGEYHIPDPLYVNYFIGSTLVNRTVVLPDTFILGEPAGLGVLQVMVSERAWSVSPEDGNQAGKLPVRQPDSLTAGVVQRRVWVTVLSHRS